MANTFHQASFIRRPMPAINDIVPDGAEAGVGLALQDDCGRYLFLLAGTRFHCPPGELFYAGIGGHRERGETWPACAHREAKEEIGANVTLRSAEQTWHLPRRSPPVRLALSDRPRPLAVYEMEHPPGTPRAGGVYYLVIYLARLRGQPRALASEEVQGVLALMAAQVVLGEQHRTALATLLDEGATVIAGGESVGRQVRLYPIGTAKALALVLKASAGPPPPAPGQG